MIFVVAIVLAILAPIVARLVQMAVSRQREFLADASGVELTRNPYGLAAGAGEDLRGHGAARGRQPCHPAPLLRQPDQEAATATSRSLFSTHPADRSTGSTASGSCPACRRWAAPRPCWEVRRGSTDPGRSGRRTPAPRLPPLRTPWYPAARRRAPAGTRVRAEIAQLVEHATENRGVASSNSGSRHQHLGRSIRAEVAQLVERNLAKVEVAGSNPVFRSTHSPVRVRKPGPAAPSSSGRTADFGSVSRGSNPRGAANLTPAARVSRIPGDVAKWPNAGVCKTSIRRFESGRRLHSDLNRPPGPAPGGLRGLAFEWPAWRSSGRRGVRCGPAWRRGPRNRRDQAPGRPDASDRGVADQRNRPDAADRGPRSHETA